MRELELREKKVNDIQAMGDKLVNEGHPGKKTVEVITQVNPAEQYKSYWVRSQLMHSSCLLCVLQSFTAALQTQWSWILQLCCCIEAHLKENTAYYQVQNSVEFQELYRKHPSILANQSVKFSVPPWCLCLAVLCRCEWGSGPDEENAG